MFGGSKEGSTKIRNYETDYERVIEKPNEALNLEDKQQVILIKRNNTPVTSSARGWTSRGSALSNFSVEPFHSYSPSRPIGVNLYRISLRIVDKRVNSNLATVDGSNEPLNLTMFV